jgi:ribosomal protein S18 acetylase RimI-like enzyme
MPTQSKPTQLTVREMTSKDRFRIKQIIDSSFSRFMGFFANLSVDEEGQVLVAETKGKVVGFTKLIEFNVGSSKYGCILWIAVDPQHRRKGVASELTKEGIQRLKKCGAEAVFASTQRRNRAALRALGGQGFRRIGFLGLQRLFSWRIFEFYRDIWLAPGEVVLVHS